MLFYVRTILCMDEICEDVMQTVMTGDQSINGIAALFINFSNFVWKNKYLVRNYEAAIKGEYRFRQLIDEDTDENTLKRAFYTTLHDKIIHDYKVDKGVRWIYYKDIRIYLVELIKKNSTFVESVYKEKDKKNGWLLFPTTKKSKLEFTYYLIKSNEYFLGKLCSNNASDAYKQYKENSEILYDQIEGLECAEYEISPFSDIYQSDIDNMRQRHSLRV